MNNLTNNGGFIGSTGNLPGCDAKISHHLTLTGDIGGGIVRAHDTFQVGSQSINLSGSYYNDLASSSGQFNPSPAAAQAFRSVFGSNY